MAHARSAAKKRGIDRDPPAAHAPGPTAEQFEAMRRQLLALTGKYNELKQATGGVTLLAPEETPIYEIGEGGYYSADDVLYPAGVQIEDITGTIIPNEQMIPLNDAAERRMTSMLQSLPRGGNTPSHELIIEAAAMVLPAYDASGKDPFEAKAELQKQILDQAMRLRMKQVGMLPGDDSPRLAVRGARTGPVPMMSNTRIRQGDVFDRGHLAGTAPMPSRGPSHTRLRNPGLAAAQKAAPPMGTVHNETIGR
jgi:hypothetical protein